MKTIDLNRCRETFLQEADRRLAEMRAGVEALAQGHDRREILNAILHAAQSVKGGAGTFGYREVASFAWTVESLVGFIRASRISLTRPRVYLLVRAVNMLEALLANARAMQGNRGPEQSVFVRIHLWPINA